MSKQHKVSVNKTRKITLSSEDVSASDLIKIDENTFHVLYNNNSIETKIINRDINNKTYTIEVNNNSYVVNIHDELDQLIESLGFQKGNSKHVNKIMAPMPGLVLEVNVNKGQEIEENDPLLILEAMKMENSIRSPRSGIIKKVHIEVSETVEKNQLLIEFE